MSNTEERVVIEETIEETLEEKNRRLIEEFCKPLVLDDVTLRQVKELFLDELKLGLCKSTNSKAVVKCGITYVQQQPTGCESGKFLILELGDKRFRIFSIHLKAGRDFLMDCQNFEIPDYMLVGPGQQIFDHLAESLATFIKNFNLNDGEEKLPLVFTFSFPVKQDALTRGVLLAWTKSFNCPDVVGRNVVDLLSEAIDRRGDLKICIIALLNDTTATMMSCAWREPTCKIGLIVGCGCNACYLEKVKNITTYQNPSDNTSPTMAINCEWGAFGDDGKLNFIRSKYDEEIDEATYNPSNQTFEKMVGGMYLGEIVRKLMLDCIKAEALFKGHVSEKLGNFNSFKTKYISQIEGQTLGTCVITREILDILGYKNASDIDCDNLHYICQTVSRRSAHLVAANIACLIERIGDPFTVVAVDGNVYRHHPHYHYFLMEKIGQLIRPEYKFKIVLSVDGIGRGAALIAATKYKSKEERRKSSKGINEKRKSLSLF